MKKTLLALVITIILSVAVSVGANAAEPVAEPVSGERQGAYTISEITVPVQYTEGHMPIKMHPAAAVVVSALGFVVSAISLITSRRTRNTLEKERGESFE